MHKLSTSLFLFISLISLAQANIVEESVYVTTTEQKVFDLVKNRPELTLDHVEKNGFELYGPRGLKEFLVQNHIPFLQMEQNSEKAKANYP
ncbi:MAG: hypothetical protein K2Q18_05275, partial [Bdellovibrionales bacterium]|nr:hypothetical protein [Bdellovibrionales bacterium]